MSLSALEYLRHILDELNYLLEQKKTLKREDLAEHQTLQRAIVRSLEVIGEAAKKIPPEFKMEHSDIEWKAVMGMRDKLIHD